MDSEIIPDLKPTILNELAAPKTPLEVREEIEKMLAAGEVAITTVQISSHFEGSAPDHPSIL